MCVQDTWWSRTQCRVEGGDTAGASEAAAQVVHRRGGEGVASEVERPAVRCGLEGVRDTLIVRETVEGDGPVKGSGGVVEAPWPRTS